jgi:hypothetical protein
VVENKPPPELPDVQARNQLARADLKKLDALRDQMVEIDKQVTGASMALRPFDYDNNVVAAMNRQEMRAHLRSMNDEQRRAAMRQYEWRAAALEQPAELSGLLPTQHKAIADETLQLRYPNELAGIAEGRAAMEAVSTAFDTVRKAVERELKTTSGTTQGPPPEKSEPWI